MARRCGKCHEQNLHEDLQVPRRYLLSFIYSPLSGDVPLLFMAHQKRIIHSRRDLASRLACHGDKHRAGIRLP